MSAGYQELFLEQGTSFNTTIYLDDVYGDAYNLSHYTASSEIRKSYYSTNATATFSTSTLDGSILLRLDANATANIRPGRYVYDVLLKSTLDAANNTIRVLEGVINVTPRVTRT